MAKDAKWYAEWLRLATAPTEDERRFIVEIAEFIENLAAELETVKRERKALLKEVNGFCWSCKNKKPSEISHNLSICEFFPKSLGMIRAKCEHWEWRGLCKENGGAEE